MKSSDGGTVKGERHYIAGSITQVVGPQTITCSCGWSVTDDSFAYAAEQHRLNRISSAD